jgi:hypothetical protein
MKTTYILTPFYVTRKEDFVGLVYCGYEEVRILQEARTVNLINISDAL